MDTIIYVLTLVAVLICVLYFLLNRYKKLKKEDNSLGVGGEKGVEIKSVNTNNGPRIGNSHNEGLFTFEEGSNETKVITTYFGTNRKNKNIAFTAESDKLTLGTCKVSIPLIHETGKLETPFMRIKILERESKHIILQSTDILSNEEFIQQLKSKIREAQNSTALIFVHGYNVTFKEAARRTAQITFDLKFRGLPMFYSWPSNGKLRSYLKDEESVVLSEKYLLDFLNIVLHDVDIKNVYVIAHSMGCRCVSNTLKALNQTNPKSFNKIKEIILSAPDINTEIFKQNILPSISSEDRIITLYASSEDKALETSNKIHDYPRAGQSGNEILIMENLETIDATGLDTGFLKHSYFGSNRTVIGDIENLISNGKRAFLRNDLIGVKKSNDKVYWKFRK